MMYKEDRELVIAHLKVSLEGAKMALEELIENGDGLDNELNVVIELLEKAEGIK